MSDESAGIPPDFLGETRIFPLPNLVLFPQVLLPLHVFEPRYRELTADSLASDQLMTISLLRPGWEPFYEGRPALYSFGCLGRIIANQKLDDGRYNLILRGLSRVRIVGELDTNKMYRTARVDVIEDTAAPSTVLTKRLIRRLERITDHWFSEMQLPLGQVARLFSGELSLGVVADVLSFALPLEMAFKQDILEELSILRRARKLIKHLECTKPPKSKPASDEGSETEKSVRQFPPDFSAN